MLKFDKSNVADFKIFLYRSYVHDAKLVSITYENQKDSLKIELFNPIFNSPIKFTFHEIEILVAIKRNEFGSRETILSVTLEEDYSYFLNYNRNQNENIEAFPYVLFEMFSGDQLHIVSKEITVE